MPPTIMTRPVQEVKEHKVLVVLCRFIMLPVATHGHYASYTIKHKVRQVSVLQSSLIPNSKFYAFSLQGTHLKIILLIKL